MSNKRSYPERNKIPPYEAGAQVGSWLLLSRLPRDWRYRYFWACECTICGTQQTVRETNLERGVSSHCRKCNQGRPKEGFQVKVGDVFGFWTITSLAPKVKESGRYVRAKCVCGMLKILRERVLLYGTSKSCGCKRGVLASKNNMGRHNYRRAGTCPTSTELNETPVNPQEQ